MTTPKFTILSHPWTPTEIIFSKAESTSRFQESTVKWMDVYWENTLEKARDHDKLLFNGPVFDLMKLDFLPEILKIELQQSDYKSYVCSRNKQFAELFPTERPVMPLAVSISILTSDGQLVIERRNANMDTNAGKFHVIGGYIDPVSDLDGRDNPSPLMAAMREVLEEIGLQLSSVNVFPLGLVMDREMPHYDYCYVATTEMTFDALKLHTLNAHTDLEVSEISSVSVSGNSLQHFLHEYSPELTPMAEGCLRLTDEWIKQRTRH